MNDSGYNAHGEGALDPDRYDNFSLCARCDEPLSRWAAHVGYEICDGCVAEITEDINE